MGVKREGQGHLSVLCPPLCGVCLGCPCLCPHPTPRPPPPRYPLLLSLQEPPVRTRELLSSPSTEPPITAWVLLALGELTALCVCVCVCVTSLNSPHNFANNSSIKSSSNYHKSNVAFFFPCRISGKYIPQGI